MTIRDAERDATERIAEKYRSDGFDVIVEPVGADLPPGLRRISADLIALKCGENVAVSVFTKGSRSSGEDVRRTAETVESEPGWRYEVLVLPRRPAERDPMTGDDASARLKAAGAAAEHDPAAGALLAWTGVEWALRRLIERQSPADRSPHRLVKEAYSLDLINEPEHDMLMRLADLRNATVHGDKRTEPAAAFLDSILQVTGSLVEKASREPTKAVPQTAVAA